MFGCMRREYREGGRFGRNNRRDRSHGRGHGRGLREGVGARGRSGRRSAREGRDEVRPLFGRLGGEPDSPLAAAPEALVCPLCDNHCPLGEPSCPKGEAYAQSMNAGRGGE